jgi:hypothetical protein
MTARIIPFPARGPFAVHVVREEPAWLVICRDHGSYQEAIREARELARGDGVGVTVNEPHRDRL